MTERTPFAAVVLAAGQGTRMRSEVPKVLHPVAGRPMVSWPVQAALEAGATHVVVVVGYGRHEVEAALAARFSDRVEAVVQPEQRGTGDAVRCAMNALQDYEGRIVIAYGDCPLLRAETLGALVDAAEETASPLGLVTARLSDPTGYGRVLRDADGAVAGIREHRDCSDAERRIDEVNPGVYAAGAGFLREVLAELAPDNAQGELYLTDIVASAAGRGGVTARQGDMAELSGVNDRYELAEADRRMRLRINEALARAGTTIRDPRTTWIDADCELEAAAVIEPGVHLRGRCRIAAGARIDVGSVLTDVRVDADAHVKPYTVATDSRIGTAAQVGPFAHLRPASELGPEARIGNFVETKKARLGKGSKANHLAYLGDGEIGEGVNIGAGTIFCNYDGYQKHTTVLEDGVFIGSDSQLVAPVRLGKGAYVASGTTVVRDVPADALAIGRTRQQNKEGYASRIRRRLEAEKRRAEEEERDE